MIQNEITDISSSSRTSSTQSSYFLLASHKAFLSLFCLTIVAMNSGCSYFQLPAEEVKLRPNQAYWFHYEASRRGGFLLMTDNTTGGPKMKMCAEPPPDVALTRTIDLIANVAYQGATGDQQAKLAEQLAQLGGRTQTVLMLRDSLFRLCELSINSGLGIDDLKTLYTEVVRAAVEVATTEATKARIAEKQADAELMKLQQLTPK